MVSRAFSSMPGLATGIAQQIRGGEIKKYLVQPINMLGFLLLTRMAHMLFSYFLSGHMFPLDMLPQPWGDMVDMPPFKYLAYYPAVVFLGKVPREELLVGLGIEACWVLFFIVTARIAFRLGVRRYSGFGG